MAGPRDGRQGDRGHSRGGRGTGKTEEYKQFNPTGVEVPFYTFKKSKSTYKQTKIKNTKKAWLKKP